MAVNKKEKTETEDKILFKVTCQRDGFRRGGRAWRGSTIVSKDELTAAQWEQLRADSLFVVQDHQPTSSE